MRRLVVLLLMLSLFGLPAGVASAESGAGTRVDRASARTGTVVLVAENRTLRRALDAAFTPPTATEEGSR